MFSRSSRRWSSASERAADSTTRTVEALYGALRTPSAQRAKPSTVSLCSRSISAFVWSNPGDAIFRTTRWNSCAVLGPRWYCIP